MEEDKMKVTGYLIVNGQIGFVNYRNKIFKSIEIRKVVDRFRNEIEEMAI